MRTVPARRRTPRAPYQMRLLPLLVAADSCAGPATPPDPSPAPFVALLTAPCASLHNLSREPPRPAIRGPRGVLRACQGLPKNYEPGPGTAQHHPGVAHHAPGGSQQGAQLAGPRGQVRAGIFPRPPPPAPLRSRPADPSRQPASRLIRSRARLVCKSWAKVPLLALAASVTDDIKAMRVATSLSDPL